MNKRLVISLALLGFTLIESVSYANIPLPPRILSPDMIAQLQALPTTNEPPETSKTNKAVRSNARLTSLHVTVNTDNNPGGFGDVGDLRYALNTMNVNLNTTPDDYAIVFDFPMTIQLNGHLPIINNSSSATVITIGNADPAGVVTIDGNSGTYAGFFIAMGDVTIQNMIFQNLTAKGGNGGTGISGGGGGMGAGAAIYVPQAFLNGSYPTVSLVGVAINNCSAIGGNGGSGINGVFSGYEGAGGGGGRSGNGGSVTTIDITGGGGGGGFGGDGGDVTVAIGLPGGGGGSGGGGLGSRATIGVLTNLANGGSDVGPGQDGNGYGVLISAGAGAGGFAGGNLLGGGAGGGGGGAGGGSAGTIGLAAAGSIRTSGGAGGDGGGGGGGGVVTANPANGINGSAGAGGYAGGGGGAAGKGNYDMGYVLYGGTGGIGGGGGGGGVDHSGNTPALGGNSLAGGGGGGGGPANGVGGTFGGTDIGNLGGGAGGFGAPGVSNIYAGGGGGGGSGIGAAVFVDSNLELIIQAQPGIPTTFNTSNNSTQAGAPGLSGPGGSDGIAGSALGNSIFLRSGSSLTLRAPSSNDILTLGTQVAVDDDTNFGAGGSSMRVVGNGTVVYNGTSDYQGTVLVNNANLKVNGQINQASVFVCRNASSSSQRGQLSGAGTVTGNVFVNSGTISPGVGETLTMGTLTLNSAGASSLGSLVGIDIDSNGTSLVAVNGAAALAGILEVKMAAGAQPGSYVVLTSTGITGTFDSVTFAGGATPNYTISYLPVGAPTFVQVDILAATTSRVTGTGTFTGASGAVNFKLSATRNANNQITASMYYNDVGARVRFDNPVVTTLNFSGAQTTMAGTVRVLGANPGNVTFTVITTDNVSPIPDSISVTLSNAYSATGTLTSGEIKNL